MKFSSLTQRLVNESPSERPAIDPWAVHNMAIDRQKQGESITLLSIGQESDECTPEVVVSAAVESLLAGRHHYADVKGELALRTAVANYHNRLTGQGYGAEAVTIFTGAQNALFALAQILLDIGDEVILVAPFYTTYEATFGAPGPTIVTVEVEASDGYQLDVEKLLAAISPKTQAVVLNAPNNPLGSRYSQDQLERIVNACVSQGIWLILDAVYLDIVNPESIALPHHIEGAKDILITVGSLSKSHRMTGWRVGWAVGPPPLSTHLANLSVCMHYGLPPFIMDAATVAIEQSTQTPLLVRSVMKERRNLAVGSLQDVGAANLIDPGEGMFVLLDVEPLGTLAYDFAVALLAAENVSVLPCDGFGPGGRYLVRIGLCIDGEALSDACQRVSQFIRLNYG